MSANKLPKKEADSFRQLVECYEKKNYKKGIKLADAILKKFPNNGETQAMKGIILNSMDKKEEAYELVKLGLRNDVRSHVCWHVYGLLYRSDNNYKEAIKCYLNALRIDPGNQNIMRDLSWLQMQMRDVVGFLSTRRKILESKSTLRASWVAFAVANYCNKMYDIAFDVIAKYHENVSEKGDMIEESELYLFQNMCLQKNSKFSEALLHLEKNEDLVLDKLSWRMRHAELLTFLGRFEEANIEWEELVMEQPENYRLHRGLQANLLHFSPERFSAVLEMKCLRLPSNAFVLSNDERSTLLAWYTNTTCKSRSIQKIVLSILPDDRFEIEMEKFMRKMLLDGVPSLCHDICSLMTVSVEGSIARLEYSKDAEVFRAHPKLTVVLKLIEKLYVDLADSPVAILWCLYLQSHLQECCGNIKSALEIIERAVAHTPTAIDILSKRARLTKKLGAFVDAATKMDNVRALDLQDRYLNNKATKYLLRADAIGLAMNTIAMFTKHEGDPQKTLFDLQCSWYELELAESYSRQKKWGLALKKFHAIRAHVLEQYDDLFDFHGYCIRKTTLRAYMDVLDFQDVSFTHKNFQRAFVGVISIYLHLIDSPEDIDGLGHLSPADRKKERAKQKKKKQAVDVDVLSGNKKDTDPEGEGLLTKDFLAEAAAWCSLVQNHLHLLDDESLALFGEVMMRKGKHLLVMKAFAFASRNGEISPAVFPTFARYVIRWKNKKFVNVNQDVAAVVKQEITLILKNESLASVIDFVNIFIEKAKLNSSLPHLIAGIKALIHMNTNAEKVTEILRSMDFSSSLRYGFPLLLDFLKFLQQSADEPQWRIVFDQVKLLYPDADYFSGKTFEQPIDPVAPEK